MFSSTQEEGQREIDGMNQEELEAMLNDDDSFDLDEDDELLFGKPNVSIDDDGGTMQTDDVDADDFDMVLTQKSEVRRLVFLLFLNSSFGLTRGFNL